MLLRECFYKTLVIPTFACLHEAIEGPYPLTGGYGEINNKKIEYIKLNSRLLLVMHRKVVLCILLKTDTSYAIGVTSN